MGPIQSMPKGEDQRRSWTTNLMDSFDAFGESFLPAGTGCVSLEGHVNIVY